MFFALVAAALLVLGAWALFRQVTVFEFERGLRYDAGHFRGVLGPGAYWILPRRTKIAKVDIRPVNIQVRRFRERMDSLLRISPPPPPQPQFADLLAAGDTSGARRALSQMDSVLAPVKGMTKSQQFGPMVLENAEQHLAFADTAAAVARLADTERPFTARFFRYSVSQMYRGTPLWSARAWLLSGDLAAARGQLEEARRMYRRVIGLWAASDPEYQPVVEQARARLNALPRR